MKRVADSWCLHVRHQRQWQPSLKKGCFSTWKAPAAYLSEGSRANWAYTGLLFLQYCWRRASYPHVRTYMAWCNVEGEEEQEAAVPVHPVTEIVYLSGIPKWPHMQCDFSPSPSQCVRLGSSFCFHLTGSFTPSCVSDNTPCQVPSESWIHYSFCPSHLCKDVLRMPKFLIL